MDVLITGGSRGIGRAVALRLAADGARIVVGFLRDEDAAAETVRLVDEAGGTAFAVQADVRHPADLQRLAEATSAHLGGLDLLVHGAAMGALKPMDTLRTGQWDLSLETSLRPFWLLTKHCLPLLREGASVIGLSSLGSRRFTPGYAALSAAKGGMEALTRQLSVELAPRGIRVNTVCGGLIRTDALDHFPDSEALAEGVAAHTPLGRLGEPADLAGPVAFLASEDARWITGQVLVVDGGFSVA